MNQFLESCSENEIKVLDMQISKINERKEKEIMALFHVKTLNIADIQKLFDY